jgi:putative transposase
MDEWLEAGHGSCILRDNDVRAILDECLRFFDQQRYFHHAWVIMPNHVHTLTTLQSDWRLDQVIGTWKRYTANVINTHLARTGTLWQEDYFDRLIRDAQHFTNTVRYIRRNPLKAKLREDEFTSFESALAKKWAP